MSNFQVGVMFAVATCIGWGTITPLVVKMIDHVGEENFNPFVPFIWNAVGVAMFAFVILYFQTGPSYRSLMLIAALFVLMVFALIGYRTDWMPVTRGWTWHWTGWAIMFVWPLAGILVNVAIGYSPQQASVINAIAASYPALVSPALLWFFLDEKMSVYKITGIGLVVIGVILATLGEKILDLGKIIAGFARSFFKFGF